VFFSAVHNSVSIRGLLFSQQIVCNQDLDGSVQTHLKILDRDPIIERRVRHHRVIYKFPQCTDERFKRQIVIYDCIPIQKHKRHAFTFTPKS
jgi:hypothetical protein